MAALATEGRTLSTVRKAFFAALLGTKRMSPSASIWSGALLVRIFLSGTGTSCRPASVFRMSFARSSEAVRFVPCECYGLQYRQPVIVLNKKPTRLANVPHNIDDACVRNHNRVPGANIDSKSSRTTRLAVHLNDNRMVRVRTMCDGDRITCVRSHAPSGGNQVENSMRQAEDRLPVT